MGDTREFLLRTVLVRFSKEPDKAFSMSMGALTALSEARQASFTFVPDVNGSLTGGLLSGLYVEDSGSADNDLNIC